MKKGKKSRIPVSKSVPSGLTTKTAQVPLAVPPIGQQSQQNLQGGGVSMVKKVEREVHRFLIQDILIFIPSSPSISTSSSCPKENNNNNNNTNNNRSTRSKSSPHILNSPAADHEFPHQTTSSPDSGTIKNDSVIYTHFLNHFCFLTLLITLQEIN